MRTSIGADGCCRLFRVSDNARRALLSRVMLTGTAGTGNTSHRQPLCGVTGSLNITDYHSRGD
ncbi:MAG: hypothetical protein LBG44_05825 [Gemmatimonadota bacterium]|nr:hypothetical protein [Gemmatimonadota bacterium]